MKAGLAGAAATIALAVPGVAQGAVITDVTGDANGVANAGLSVATAPVSDASRDLTQVDVDRTADGIVVRFHLAAAPQLGGAPTFAILRGQRGVCGVSLAVAWGGEGGPTAVSDLDDCDEEFFGIGAPGFSAAVEGTTLVARYPYAALAGNRMGIGPSTALTDLRAETRIGTFGSSGGFSSCSPEPCEPNGFSYARSGFIGPLVDITEGQAALTPAKAIRRLAGRRTRR